jgi:hypothetical protein
MWRRATRPSKRSQRRAPRGTNPAHQVLNPPQLSASKPAAAMSPSLAPSTLASATGPPPLPPPRARRITRTASSPSPTTTHTSRPRSKAHASHHAVRGTQERRLVRSRFQSQPGQAREADSRPGPLSSTNQKEHWSKARSATPKTRDQAHSFYRTRQIPSISPTSWRWHANF